MVGYYVCEERIYCLCDFELRLEGVCINGGQSELCFVLCLFLNCLCLQDDIYCLINFNLNFVLNLLIEKDKDIL